MSSHFPRRSPRKDSNANDPPAGLPAVPIIPAAQHEHHRSPSASSASSTSSAHSHSGFTVFRNTSTTTVKLVPPSAPTTPRQKLPHSVHGSPNAANTSPRPGYFEPTLMPSMAESAAQRKRAATEPGPTSPPLAGNTMAQAQAQIAARAEAFAREVPVNVATSVLPGQAIPHPPPQAPLQTAIPGSQNVPPPSTSAPPTTKKESSKMKIFSIPIRTGTPNLEKALRPPPSPRKLPDISAPIPRLAASTSASAARQLDETRRPSFSSLAPTTSFGSSSTLVEPSLLTATYSESPPTASHKDHSTHKPHFLRPRRDKEHSFSSSSSNSKPDPASSGASLYSFAPSSPSSIKPFPLAGDLIEVPDDPSTPENAWFTLRHVLLPLFDGEPLRPPVEELNKLVNIHLKTRPTALAMNDVHDLLNHGMASLASSLPPDLPDDRLVPRLVELWSLAFAYITPYLEAVLLPVQQTTHTEIRRLVMCAFRDQVLLPLHPRLRFIFSRLQMDFSRSQREATEVVGRVLQCVSVLANLRRGEASDEGGKKMEELSSLVKWNWLSRGRVGRDRRGFVGVKMGRVGG